MICRTADEAGRRRHCPATERDIMRTRLPICVVLLVSLLAFAQSGAAAERGQALVGFNPAFERVGGDSTYARMKVTYDGTSTVQGLRGFHAVIEFADDYVYIGDAEADVFEGDLLASGGNTAFFTTLDGDGRLVVDGSILGATGGVHGPGELFEIRFTGRSTGDGVSPVEIVELVLRDPDNAAIASDVTGASLELDNTPPDVPVLAPLPTYSPGLTRTIYWSDESASGAVGYCGESADNPDFDPIYMSSGCTPLTYATFVNLDDGQIYYYRVRCRDDLWNVSANSASVHSTQDASPPVSSAGPINAYYNTMAFWIPVTASDATSGVALVRLMYSLDGGPYQQFDGTFPVGPIYFQANTEGAYDFYTIATDAVGNAEDPPSVPDCSTIVDWTNPPPPVDFVAAPGHNKIHLSWTVPEDRNAPIEGTLIVRKLWSFGAYPEYDDVSPPNGYPTNPGNGALVAFVPGTGTQTYDDDVFTDHTRNIYYYTAFTRDFAGNYSPAAASAQDRSTSYWLADVSAHPGGSDYDGFVDFYDKVVLSDCYYTQDGDSFYVAEMDVGPTDDSSRFGIPLTDNWIDFEDLMIVAMNYGRVDPSWKRTIAAGFAPSPSGELGVSLDSEIEHLEVGDELDVVITADGSGFPFRGLSCRLEYDPQALEFICADPAGALSGDDPDLFFYAGLECQGTARVDLALLGPGRAVTAPGPVGAVRFRVKACGPTRLALSNLKARSDENGEIPCVGGELVLGGEDSISGAALEQNVPNPFNPFTTISFEIPRESHVVLTVYSAGGRLVARLVDGLVPAGRRSVRWDARGGDGNVLSSGIYFCVLDVDGKRLTKKMVLAK